MECRGDAGACDVAETCDGGGACPVDAFEAPGTPCEDQTNTTCNAANSCDAGGVCLDNFADATVECREDEGACDVAETCDGVGACPVDAFETPGTGCDDGDAATANDQCGIGVCQGTFVATVPAASIPVLALIAAVLLGSGMMLLRFRRMG